jgi:hypothetical protein
MSANDPKRTCRTGSKSFRQGSMRWLHWEIDGFARCNKRLAALALIHSVHNHTDDDGNDSTTHTTADQLTSERSGA